jgi:hypothetical protein
MIDFRSAWGAARGGEHLKILLAVDESQERG